MTTARYPYFLTDIGRARDLVGLGQSLGSMTHGVVDGADLFRAALVQSVAALDHYIHGVVLDRAVSILMGREAPGSGTKVGISFVAVRQILLAPTAADQEQMARTHVAQRLALETFQKPDDIATALAMVGVAKIWSTAFSADPAAAKLALSLIVDRRNKIVHQGDSDPLNPGTPTPLSDIDALDAVNKIGALVASVDNHC